ncbi:hypothetical protein FRC04_012103 [Tulasnella sp. 424]|nr:hypothetical protein FRC04_012103 [Tulasnella sp. 424]
MLLRLAALLTCTLFSTLSKAQDTVHLVDTIVDDSDPSIVYDSNPSGPWVTTSSLSWDITKLYRGTGVKVVIAARDMPGAWTNVSFFLDGTKQGEYIWEGTEANQLIYNITAFETLALTNSSHVLDIVGGQGPDIAMYLDYIQYTQLLPVTASSMMSSSSATQLSSSASITAIASTPTSSATPVTSSTPSALLGSLRPPGISIAGIVGIGMMVGVSVLLVANLAIWIHRRKKKATKRPRYLELVAASFRNSAPQVSSGCLIAKSGGSRSKLFPTVSNWIRKGIL